MHIQRKTEAVRFLTNPAEKAALRAIAQQERRNMSEALREMIRERADALGLWPPAPEVQQQEVQP